MVDGLLRRGEVGNVVAAPKKSKSWLVLSLALSVATGRPWLGRFATAADRVLLIDNELHPESLAFRVREVARGMGLTVAAVADRVDVLTLRGRLRSLAELGPFLDGIEPGRYGLLILDALYRFLPAEAENDNGAIAQVYNSLDALASRLDCAVVAIHHSSKGVQGSKSVTDVGSGAGSQSRAADLHAVIREHEEPDAAVLDAVVRSFPPVEPVGLRWSFPCWHADPDVDPARLKRERGAGGRPRKSASTPAAAKPLAEWDAETFAASFVTSDPTPGKLVLARAASQTVAGFAKLSASAANRLLMLAVDAGHAHRHTLAGQNTAFYASRPQRAAESTQAALDAAFGGKTKHRRIGVSLKNDGVCVTRTPPVPPTGAAA